MTPSVGRIVHYVSHGTPAGPDGSQAYASECRAAIVTEVGAVLLSEGERLPGGTLVGLCVLSPAAQFFNRCVIQDEDNHAGGTWHWPERTQEP